MHTLGASKCMHVVHSVGFGGFYLSRRERHSSQFASHPQLYTSSQEVFGLLESVKIQVTLNPTGGYMLTSSGFAAFIHWRFLFYRVLVNNR